MSTTEPPREPSEEELRAAYEAEIKKIRVEHVLLETRRHARQPRDAAHRARAGTEDRARSRSRCELAIDAIRAVLPLLERTAPAQVGPIRDALSQLQLAYVEDRRRARRDRRRSAEPPAAEQPAAGPPPEPEAPKPGEPGPAQRSGKLWVPGQ